VRCIAAGARFKFNLDTVDTIPVVVEHGFLVRALSKARRHVRREKLPVQSSRALQRTFG
jgi:hypothetical protein